MLRRSVGSSLGESLKKAWTRQPARIAVGCMMRAPMRSSCVAKKLAAAFAAPSSLASSMIWTAGEKVLSGAWRPFDAKLSASQFADTFDDEAETVLDSLDSGSMGDGFACKNLLASFDVK